MVNYEEEIKKPFTDVKNLIIGIVLSLIPIVNFTIVTGFTIECSGLGKMKPSKKMPEWKDWTYLFITGLTALVIRIIYMIPAIAVILIGLGLAAGDIAGAILGMTMTPEVMSQLGTSEAASQQIGQIIGSNWYLLLPVILKVAPILILGFILAAAAAFLTPMAVLNYVKNRKFSAAFELGKVLKKSLTGQYVLAWLAVLVLGAVLGTILSFIPILGPAIATFVVGVISFSLYGEVYREVKN